MFRRKANERERERERERKRESKSVKTNIKMLKYFTLEKEKKIT